MPHADRALHCLVVVVVVRRCESAAEGRELLKLKLATLNEHRGARRHHWQQLKSHALRMLDYEQPQAKQTDASFYIHTATGEELT